MGQETKVNQDSSGELIRLNGTFNSGHFLMNAKDGIWVIVMAHRDVITTKELVIWHETVRTIIIVASLVICRKTVRTATIAGSLGTLLEIAWSKTSQLQNRAMQKSLD